MPTVADVMTTHPICCTPQNRVADAALIMREHDCGVVPVVEDQQSMRLVGLITDRDIVVRLVASDVDPRPIPVGECLTGEVRALGPDASLDECRALMESAQVRRIPIVDTQKTVIGIVSLADLVDEVPDRNLGATVSEVSDTDHRQLYGETKEVSCTRGVVTSPDQPHIEHRVTG